MSTTRKIAHNTIVQIAGKIISTLLGLLAIGMMTRYLGQEQFGWYITTIAFLQFIGILIDFGLIPVTAQMLSEPGAEKNKLFSNLLGFRFTTSVIFLAIAPLIALFFPYPPEVKIAIAFSTISFFAIAMNQIFVGFLQTKLKMHLQAIGEIAGRVALVIGLWAIISNYGSFLHIIGIIVFSSLVYTAILWITASKHTVTRLAFDWPIWKKIMAKMWPIAISIIFNVVYLKGDIILLSLFKSQSEVGIYGAAYRVIDIVAQTAMMLMGVILPLLAYHWTRNQKQEFKQRYQQAFDSMMMLAIPMTVGIIMLSSNIMGLIAGDNFIISGRPLQILAIAVFGVYVGAVFGHTAVAINKQKQVMWIYISNAVITLTGYLIFIPLYGMYGAAWMTVFSEIYAGLLLWIVVRYYCGQKLQFATFGKILISSLTMAASIYAFNYLHILLTVIIGGCTYFATLCAIGGISQKTIRDIIMIKTK